MTFELITFNHLRCHSSSTELGTIIGLLKPTQRGTYGTPLCLPHWAKTFKIYLMYGFIGCPWSVESRKSVKAFRVELFQPSHFQQNSLEKFEFCSRQRSIHVCMQRTNLQSALFTLCVCGLLVCIDCFVKFDNIFNIMRWLARSMEQMTHRL